MNKEKYKKNKKTMLALCIIFLMIFAIVTMLVNENSKMRMNSADWVYTYGSGEDVVMIEEADLICEGRVVDSFTELRHDLVFTHQVVEIISVEKGMELVDCEQKIEILQTGGTFEKVVTKPFAEAPLLRKGEHYYLILQATDEGHFLPMGGYQGVGTINNKGIVTFSESCEDVFSSLNKRTIENINENVKNVIDTSNEKM